MNKQLIATAVFSAIATISAPLSALAADAPATPEHSFTGNVTLASEYLYRGIAQTRGKPALQGGFDYAHASGLYV
ncbi:MAG: TorF family putative porin, partial [Rhodocyclaceae bacterium]|nr:TorF family putative porin [Rhodocyclaceae bacterium]